MNSTVYIYVNSIACYGPWYICKCKRHDNVRYECITNGLFGTLATERICSAVLLNCTKARIEPLFELNRTAASVASSNNGMPTFSTPSTHKKKIPAECWRAKKIICKRILEKKNFIVNQGVEKKFHDQTKSPPPPSEVEWSAPYTLLSLQKLSRLYFNVTSPPKNVYYPNTYHVGKHDSK